MIKRAGCWANVIQPITGFLSIHLRAKIFEPAPEIKDTGYGVNRTTSSYEYGAIQLLEGSKIKNLSSLAHHQIGISLAVSVHCGGGGGVDYTRADFPSDFVFGAGTTAYQVEGAANEDGRTPSVWDTYVHAASNIEDVINYLYEIIKRALFLAVHVITDSHAKMSGYSYGATGDVTCDQYHKYKAVQRGLIGIGMFLFGYFPMTNSEEDLTAFQRAKDFMHGWILHPLVFGDYPSIMKKIVGTRLPVFTDDESQLVTGSGDFIGVIHYFTLGVKDNSSTWDQEERDIYGDMGVESIFGNANDSTDWSHNPKGLEGGLQQLKEAYGNIPIYIYENGLMTPRNSSLEDTNRVEYLHGLIGAVLNALRNGSDVRGYFVWSFMDVLELLDGLRSGFGLYYVDLDDPNLRRYPKLSAHWYSQFLKGGSADPVNIKPKLLTSI
ncbi:hypothetical protein ACFE04_018793 [Oxalis oulophora]